MISKNNIQVNQNKKQNKGRPHVKDIKGITKYTQRRQLKHKKKSRKHDWRQFYYLLVQAPQNVYIFLYIQ